MAYGELKVDSITFTDGGSDTTVSVSGLVKNPTFSGNIVVSGNISGITITGNSAGFGSVTGVTVTGTTANFVTVSGTTVTGDTGNFTSVSATTATITSGVFASGTAAAPSVSVGTTDNGLYSPGTNQVAISTNGTGRLFVNDDGRIGIGVASAGGNLHIQGATGDACRLYLTDGDTAGVGNSFLITKSGDNTSLIERTSGSSLIFSTADTERLRIDSSGRLLIGTSSARTNFLNTTFLGANIQEEAASGGTRGISTTNNSADNREALLFLNKANGSSLGSTDVVSNGNRLGSIFFQGADGTTFIAAAQITAEVDGTPGADDMPGRLVFSVTADGASSPTERMRIDNAGNVFIGTQVAPSGSDNGTRILGGLVDTSRNTTAAIGHYRFYNPNGQVGSISTSGSATAYNTSSDYRLKENVVPLTGAANRLNQLQVHRFNFIADPDTTVDGFIAHEAQAVVPECVTGTKDEVDDEGNPVYQGIDQSKLVPLLTAALQEAIGRIESLETEVAALKAS